VKKFLFPLQKVLEYDTHIQKNESDILAALMAEFERLEKKRDGMQEAYNDAKRLYQRDCENGQSASRAAAAGMYITDQRQQLKKIGEQMREQMRRIDKQRERLLAITQDKTMIEKLKEHAMENYLKQERKNDELFIAEFISNQVAKAGS
jgi:flagellar export protein FliJ